MHAVGAGLHRDVDAVVHDKDRAVRVARLRAGLCLREPRGLARLLHPQLDPCRPRGAQARGLDGGRVTGPSVSGDVSSSPGAGANISLPGISVAAGGSVENLGGGVNVKAKAKGKGGLFGHGKPKKSHSKENVDVSMESEGGGEAHVAAHPEGGFGVRHEVKHKRHVIEEIIIEDSDKYYENQEKRPRTLPRKAKKAKANIEITPTGERRRSTGEVEPMDVGAAGTGSVQNVSTQQVTFMVEYEPPNAKAGVKFPSVPKVGKDFHLFGKKPDIGADVGASAEAKLKRPHQEEVVVFDGEFSTDSLQRKKAPFGKRVDVHGESVTGTLEGDAGIKAPHGKGKIEAGISGSLPEFKFKSGRQEEVVVDDTHLHADKNSPGWMGSLKFSGRLPSANISLGQAAGSAEQVDLKKSTGSLASSNSETITYVVTSDLPGGTHLRGETKNAERQRKPLGRFR